MSYRCQLCGKGTVLGEKHTHKPGVASAKFRSKAPRTAKKFKPNLQMVTIATSSAKVKTKVCMKCLKGLKRELSAESVANK